MEKLTQIQGSIVAIPVNDIDTDQIIPARFLKVTDKDGLGQAAFCDWRYLEDGETPNPDFILNNPAYRGASVLVAGDNFGLRQLARACALGTARRRIPGRGQHGLRRHISATTP